MKTRRMERMFVALVCVVATTVLMTAGCSHKKKIGPSGEELGSAGGGGFGDESLSGASSMQQFEQTGNVTGGGVYRDVHFNYDSFQLDTSGMDAVRANASLLQSSGRRVEIEGHCDERGTSEYNLALGAKRARSVKDALVGLGITADRLDTVSYGEELPLCRESTESCWVQNRRAHLVDR